MVIAILIGCLVLLAIAIGIGWLYMLFDTLRDAICPPKPFQRHWKWRLAALLVSTVTLCSGILVILLMTTVVLGVTK